MKRLWIICALALSACVTVSSPRPPAQPGPVPVPIEAGPSIAVVALRVVGPDGPIAGAMVTACGRELPTRPDGRWVEEFAPAPTCAARAIAPGYLAWTGEVPAAAGQNPEFVITLQRPPPPAFGTLTTDGPIFRSGGQAWRWRGVSAFKLAKRFERGENIDGFLEDFKGYNVLRVWDYTPEADWGANAWTSTTPDAWIRFLDYVGRHGFRVEITLLTDDDPARIEPARQLVAALVAARPPNVLLEAGNEPTTHKRIDTAALRTTLETSGFPYTSGDYEDSQRFYGSYGVFHSARDDEWPRRAHDAIDYFNGGGPNAPTDPAHRVPWICDEPGKWQDVGTDPKDWRAYAGACSLLAGGFTFHFESGKFGDRPTELERSLAAAALAALNAFPDDAPKGPYGRPADDSLRTYTVGSYAVRVRPTSSTPPFAGTALDADGILWRLNLPLVPFSFSHPQR